MATIGVLAFALAVGTAYAYPIEEVMPADMSNYNYTFNGISVLDMGPGCSMAEGAGAGGLAYDTPGLDLKNGITGFSILFEAKSSCEESVLSSGPTRDNGVTIFDTAPIEAN